MSKFYLTTPIYYASGPPHAGHAFTTTYADVIARYRRQHGDDVFLLTGMDEHGSKIAEKAAEENRSPQEFVDDVAAEYQKLWQSLDISNDIFIRTTSEKHKIGVRKFFDRLRAADAIYEEFYEGLYCAGCEDFITESKLVNGLCPDHAKPPELIKEKNYFLNLKQYLPAVREKIISDTIHIRPDSRRKEILNVIDSGIPNFSMTRDRTRVPWGIPFPYDDSQTIYVWGDALLNYLTALDFPDGDLYKKFWPADLHIIGSEINKFHSIYWPAMLLAADVPLPKSIFVHGLFTVNGQKMSKTIGNVINPDDLISRYGTDGARYLLLSQFPASEHGDIKADEFDLKYNADLANGLGNLFERIFSMLRLYNISPTDEETDPEIASACKNAEEEYHRRVGGCELFEALQTVFLFIKTLDRYINEKTPWNMAKEGERKELVRALNSLFHGAETIIEWLTPFLPEKMAHAKEYACKLKAGTLAEDKKLNLFPRL